MLHVKLDFMTYFGVNHYVTAKDISDNLLSTVWVNFEERTFHGLDYPPILTFTLCRLFKLLQLTKGTTFIHWEFISIQLTPCRSTSYQQITVYFIVNCRDNCKTWMLQGIFVLLTLKQRRSSSFWSVFNHSAITSQNSTNSRTPLPGIIKEN